MPSVFEKFKCMYYSLIQLILISFEELGRRSQPHLSTIWRHVRLEMAPPMPSEFPQIQKSFINLKNSLVKGKFLNLTTKEAAANTLVGVEIFFWFIVGEMIGRKSVVGYNV